MKNSPSQSMQQKGFSLIELLIASTLGVFIVGGIIINFISTKDSEKVRSAISEIDSNARTALQIIRQNVSHAGYPSTKNIRIEKPFYSQSDGPTTNLVCSGGTHMNGATPGTDEYTSDTDNGDIMTVVYLADNPCLPGKASCTGTTDINPDALVYTDCLGGGGEVRDSQAVSCSVEKMPSAEDAKIYSTFYVSNDDHTLYCRGNRRGEMALVEDIENIQFLYGVKQDDGTRKYLDATRIEQKNWWGLVNSVQVGLLVRSYDKNVLKQDGKEYYTVLDKKIKVKDRRRMYRVYSTTIDLPNQRRGEFL